jgi:hypothetical protein
VHCALALRNVLLDVGCEVTFKIDYIGLSREIGGSHATLCWGGGVRNETETEYFVVRASHRHSLIRPSLTMLAVSEG